LSSRAEERLGRKPSKGLFGARGSPVLGLERKQVVGVLKEQVLQVMEGVMVKWLTWLLMVLRESGRHLNQQ